MLSFSPDIRYIWANLNCVMWLKIICAHVAVSIVLSWALHCTPVAAGTQQSCLASELGVHQAILVDNICLVHPGLAILKTPGQAQADFCAANFSGAVATGETPEKWNALKRLIVEFGGGKWTYVALKQNLTTNDHLKGWQWKLANNLTVDVSANFFKAPNVDSSVWQSNIEDEGIFQFSAGTLYFADSKLPYGFLCEFEVKSPKPKSIVEEMVDELTLECHNQHVGIMIGSSCYFLTLDSTEHYPYAQAQTALMATNTLYTGRMAHIYTKEILYEIGEWLAKVKPTTNDWWLWISLDNDLSTGLSYWHDADTEGAVHGLRQTDRPALPGAATAASAACSYATLTSSPPTPSVVRKSANCGNIYASYAEKRVHGHRYELHSATRYFPNYPILANFTSGITDERNCATKCLNQAGCLAYNFMKTNGICELLPSKATTADDTGTLSVNVNAWSYYERVG